MSNNSKVLIEELGHNQANVVAEAFGGDNGSKDLYLKGIFIQGEIRNQNGRVYPASEIRKAVNNIQSKIDNGYSILGEVDHPDTLNINIDRVSHMIESMEMQGNDGIGKLKIIDTTPMGKIIRALIESNVKLGVSSRGSGDLDSQGKVSNYEIITVDIVANPSAQDAYPKAIYESLMNMNNGQRIIEAAQDAAFSYTAEQKIRAQAALTEEIVRLIKVLNTK